VRVPRQLLPDGLGAVVSDQSPGDAGRDVPLSERSDKGIIIRAGAPQRRLMVFG
jgi:hypothetical protein